MLNNHSDKTFQLAIMGYRNGLEKILLSIKDPMIFIDIGANQGVFSLFAARNVNFKQIHAFEPNLKLVLFLKKNFFVNSVDNFFIHQVAIGKQSRSVEFYVPKNHSGNGRITSEKGNTKVVCVNRAYLNSIFAQSTESYFIKIDVEGSEYDVLNELFNSNMSLMIKYIFIEINSRFSDETVLNKKLNINGFYEKFRSGSRVSYDALFIRQ
jgi:FkbM family methyltransferase